MTVAAGGAWLALPSASYGHAALTIGGRTIAFDGKSFGVVTAGAGERTFSVLDFSTPGVSFAVVANLFDPTRSLPSSLESAGTWTGGFDQAADANSVGPSSFYIDYGDGRLAAGGLAPTAVTIAISAVPEAPSWAMMIIGFGTIATFLRRTRRSPLTA